MTITTTVYSDILKQLNRIIDLNKPTQPIPVYKSFEDMVTKAEKTLDESESAKLSHVLPPRTPATMMFSKIKSQGQGTSASIKPRVKLTHNLPFFPMDMEDGQNNYEDTEETYAPTYHSASSEESPLNLSFDTAGSKQKEAALQQIEKIRDNIQREYKIISRLAPHKQETAAVYLTTRSETNTTSENFFKDLKDLKRLINQIPLCLNARKSDIEIFAAQCLTLIRELSKYDQRLTQHLTQRMPLISLTELEPIELGPLAKNANSDTCYNEKCSITCSIM